MRTNRTPDEWADWCIAKNQIAEVLKEYYRTCTTEELPPQLLTLLKKLDDELLKRQEQYRHCLIAASRRLGLSRKRTLAMS
jgi:hypothetical protein